MITHHPLKTSIENSPPNSGIIIIPAIKQLSITDEVIEPTANIPVEFTDAIAHEIRNPLANINLSVSILEVSTKDKEVLSYLNIIKKNADRINNLVGEILKYKQSGKEVQGKHSIHELLDEVLQINEDKILAKKIIVKKQYCTSALPLLFSRSEMKIALSNLILNAVESVLSVKGELIITTANTDTQFILEINCGSNGVVAADPAKPNLLNKTAEPGIGLAATYNILQFNNVKFKVSSETSKGMCFRLSFQIP